jgi:hypothetical protein
LYSFEKTTTRITRIGENQDLGQVWRLIVKVWFVGAAKYRLESVDGVADSRILVQVSLVSCSPAQKQDFDTSSFVTLPSGAVFEKY